MSYFLFESSRTRTGSIYISFCLRSTPVGSKPTSTGCCEPLLNACHRHAATSNARYGERLETLKKINGFRLFLCLLNWVRTCDFLWQGNLGKTSWQMPFPWYSDFPQESVDCRYTLMLLWCWVEDGCERSKLSGGQRKYRCRMTMETISGVETNQNYGAKWPGKE